MKTALLFAGQGVQRGGMLHSLPAEAGQDLLMEASAILGFDVRELDAPERLADTWSTQLCIFLWEMIGATRLSGRGFMPDYVFGQSIGAFDAAVACGALRFADALRLVDLRGRTMRSCCPAACGMLAVQGLSLPIVEQCAGTHGVYVASINAPEQIVLSGTLENLKRALAGMRRQYAVRATWLRIAVASHCALMEPAREVLLPAAERLTFFNPHPPYLANGTGRCARTAQAVKEDLVHGAARTVRLYDCLTLLHELGVRRLVEVSPVPVLSRMGRELFPDSKWECVAEGGVGG